MRVFVCVCVCVCITYVSLAAHTRDMLCVRVVVAAHSKLPSAAGPIRTHAGPTLAPCLQQGVAVVTILTPAGARGI